MCRIKLDTCSPVPHTRKGAFCECTEKNAKEDEYKFTIKKFVDYRNSEDHITATYQSANVFTNGIVITTRIGKLPLMTSKFIF